MQLHSRRLNRSADRASRRGSREPPQIPAGGPASGRADLDVGSADVVFLAGGRRRGVLYSPAIDPQNPSDIYIASDMGELFHTTTAARAGRMFDFRQIQGSTNSRVEFTNNPEILYSIDYTDPTGSGDSFPAESTDGGTTWQDLAKDPTDGSAFSLFADPSNSNVLVVSDYDDLYFSNNGGTTWSTSYTNDNGGQGLAIAGAFFSGSNIYVGTNSGLLVSSNGGTSFSLSSLPGIPSGSAMISFSVRDLGRNHASLCRDLGQRRCLRRCPRLRLLRHRDRLARGVYPDRWPIELEPRDDRYHLERRSDLRRNVAE